MTGTELKIKFLADKGFLTNDRSLTFEQVRLPGVAKSFKSPAFWVVKVISHIPNERRLHVEILSYHVGECKFSDNQRILTNKLNEIETISFKSIDTDGLFITLRETTPIDFLAPQYKAVDRQEYAQKQSHAQKQPVSLSIKNEPIKSVINETFYVPIKNVRFSSGNVSFDRKLKDYNKTIQLVIPNNSIREEFDAIKNYFANVLGTKRIKVTTKILIIDNKVESIEAKSPEIDRINEELINDVKLVYVKATFKRKISDDIDKSFFTMEEFFTTFGDAELKSKAFYSDEKEFLEDLLHISKTKHYNHLRFLSSKHAHKIMRLRFVHKPFSFIFLIEGEINFHIIWESLDTQEATYVWHFQKDCPALQREIKKIEYIINDIKLQGKSAYINSNNDPFKRIFHDYSELAEGFVKWKRDLESILI